MLSPWSRRVLDRRGPDDEPLSREDRAGADQVERVAHEQDGPRAPRPERGARPGRPPRASCWRRSRGGSRRAGRPAPARAARAPRAPTGRPVGVPPERTRSGARPWRWSAIPWISRRQEAVSSHPSGLKSPPSTTMASAGATPRRLGVARGQPLDRGREGRDGHEAERDGAEDPAAEEAARPAAGRSRCRRHRSVILASASSRLSPSGAVSRIPLDGCSPPACSTRRPLPRDRDVAPPGSPGPIPGRLSHSPLGCPTRRARMVRFQQAAPTPGAAGRVHAGRRPAARPAVLEVRRALRRAW